MRKGQAALEYLMIHGWAILILLIVLVTLYSLGVLNPGSYANEECVFLPGFECKYHLLKKATTSYTLDLTTTDGLGFDISIVSANLSARGIGSSQLMSYSGTVTPSTGTIVKQGSDIKFSFVIPFDSANPATPDVGQVQDMNMVVVYKNCGVATLADCSDAPQHSISGRIVARIEQG